MSKDNYINTDQIKDFVKTSPDYYIHEFEKINNTSKFVLSFNLFAFLFGSMWFGIRNIWNWSLAFLIIETFAIVQSFEVFLETLVQRPIPRSIKFSRPSTLDKNSFNQP